MTVENGPCLSDSCPAFRYFPNQPGSKQERAPELAGRDLAVITGAELVSLDTVADTRAQPVHWDRPLRAWGGARDAFRILIRNVCRVRSRSDAIAGTAS